jgi:hypothetical protein
MYWERYTYKFKDFKQPIYEDNYDSLIEVFLQLTQYKYCHEQGFEFAAGLYLNVDVTNLPGSHDHLVDVEIDFIFRSTIICNFAEYNLKYRTILASFIKILRAVS